MGFGKVIGNKMMKKINLKKVVGVLGVVILALGITIFCVIRKEKPAEKPAQKPELSKQAEGEGPKLLWKKTFDGRIDFSMSNDANFILVHSEKWDDDKVKVARYLLNKTGKTIQKEENEGLYTKEGRMDWKDTKKGGLKGVLSGDGEHIITARGIENREGKLLSKGDFLISQFKVPIYSPSGKYIVTIPGYEGAFPHILRVYSTKSGKLLWQFQRANAESCEVPFLASFISDEKLAIYTEGKIILFDTKSGRRYWEKFLFGKYEELLGPQNIISSKTGNIVLFHPTPNATFSLDKNGKTLWTRKESIRLVGISNGGNFLVGYSNKNLFFFDNKTGEIFWQKRFRLGGGFEFSPDDKFFLIHGLLAGDKEVREKEVDRKGRTSLHLPRGTLYIFDTMGNIKWRFEMQSSIGETVRTRISADGKKLAFKDRSNFYLFDTSNL